jgi:biotin operon repressor
MRPRISSEVRAAIWAHHQNLLSGQKISDMLKAAGMTASKRAVNRIIKEITLERQGIVKPPKRLGTQNLPSVRTPALIKKVKNLLNRPDPYTQPDIGRMLGVSKSTVQNIAKFDLGGEVRKKTRTHAQSDKQVAQRVAKGPRPLKHIHRQNVSLSFPLTRPGATRVT